MLEELPADIRVVLRKSAEVPKRHDETTERRLGGHGRRTGLPREHRNLSEILARADGRDRCTGDANRGRTLGDDEEPDAVHVTFANNRPAWPEAALFEAARELPQLPLVEFAEERNAIEVVCESRHASILIRRGRFAAQVARNGPSWRSGTNAPSAAREDSPELVGRIVYPAAFDTLGYYPLRTTPFRKHFEHIVRSIADPS